MSNACRFSLVMSALLACAGLLESQSSRAPRLQRVTQPLRAAHLDLDTGVLTRGPRMRNKTAQTVSDFSNLDLGGFAVADTGAGFCEWIDAGIKGTSGNGSDLMSEIVFAYCSRALDPSSGGPGGSVRLGFYEGYVAGGGAPTSAVAVFTLSGLPAHTGNCGFIGGDFTCYFMSVSFSPLVSFADGPIGYSWRFVDDGGGACGTFSPELALTFPFLACVQSCSGPGPDGLGMVDSIDQYCPPGTLRTTFSFGTTPFGSYFTSISMDIREAKDVVATAVPWSGDGVNEDTLTASAAILGATWSASVTSVNPHGSGGPFAVRVRSTTGNGPSFPSPHGGRLNEFLVGGALLATLHGTHDGSTGSLAPQPIPKDAAFLCFPWAAQATITGGGFTDLTTAVSGVVGTE